MLRLERVSKFYSANGMVSTGFSKVDLKFSIGEFVAITGESGSGKSTLLNVISGLDSFEEGEMYIMGKPTSGFSREDLEKYRKEYIGNIFQSFNLINSYTVYQNVELVLLMSGYDKAVIPGKVREIIDKVGLSAYEKTKASKLSGGQKQRVAIARALAKETPIIVADEPTGNLDSKSAAEIMKLLYQLSGNKLIIVVTHNYDQVEPYVTRKITMHDGKVAEDKYIMDRYNGLTETSDYQTYGEVKTAKADALSFGDMARLGIRNAFNIPAKFLLLLAVFIFLCSGVIGEYGAVMNMNELVSSQGYNNFFVNTEKNRIVVSKEDGSAFSDSDYNKLETIGNVERIVRNDLMLDESFYLTDDPEEGVFYTLCKTEELDVAQGMVTEGRMPQNSREAVLLIPREGYATGVIGEMMEKDSWLIDQNTGNKMLKEKIKIVGYGYLDEEDEKKLEADGHYFEAYLCVGDETLSSIRNADLEKYCSQELSIGGYILDIGNSTGFSLAASKEVPEGEVYLPEEAAVYVEANATGTNVELTNKSLYFTDTWEFTVGAVYNKETLSYYLGLENFEEVSGSIFINPEDYKKIFDKGNFQSSVIVKDEMMAEETRNQIVEMGYKAFCVRDGLVSYNGGLEIIPVAMFTVMLAAILIVMFFITYFIIKLILKSRNVYFSTIRMLGATKKNCRSLLKTELFVVFNLAFFFSAFMAFLFEEEIIDVDALSMLTSYLSAKDYVILYGVLCLMSLLLAGRYARQLFRQTAMNAYKEEV